MFFSDTVERHLSGLTGTAGNRDMQKIRIIGFLFENSLGWQIKVRQLQFTVCTCVYIFRPRLIQSSRSHKHCTVLDPITGNLRASHLCRILDQFTQSEKKIRIIGNPGNQRQDKWSYNVLCFFIANSNSTT
jgi:hypothetical protein